MMPPSFWYDTSRRTRIVSAPLSPFACFYEKVSFRCESTLRLPKPSLCVGNVVLGGAGKTPVAKALALWLQSIGKKPAIVSRGYGGSLKGPVQVNPNTHSFLDVGDEPLLLSRDISTWIGRNRYEVALRACQEADIILLDDGLQSNYFAYDYKILVMDHRQGIGNGYVFPRGPLREPLQQCLKRINAIIWVGPMNDFAKHLAKDVVLIEATPSFQSPLPPKTPVIGFCGIGFPQKFESTLDKLGLHVCDFIKFSDHHPYSEKDMAYLIKRSRELSATLITTEKDFVRIPHAYQKNIHTIQMTLSFNKNHLDFTK